MANPGNQHCASCIGTLSFPITRLDDKRPVTKVSKLQLRCLTCLLVLSQLFEDSDLLSSTDMSGAQQETRSIGEGGLNLGVGQTFKVDRFDERVAAFVR